MQKTAIKTLRMSGFKIELTFINSRLRLEKALWLELGEEVRACAGVATLAASVEDETVGKKRRRRGHGAFARGRDVASRMGCSGRGEGKRTW